MIFQYLVLLYSTRIILLQPGLGQKQGSQLHAESSKVSRRGTFHARHCLTSDFSDPTGTGSPLISVISYLYSIISVNFNKERGS